MNYWWILYTIDGLLFLPTALTIIYLLLFAVAALFKHKDISPKAKQNNRFIVLIPAYNSDQQVFDTVNSILGQTYPQRLFDIVVISDHQSELANMRLAQMPITLLTPNFESSSKAKSLQYAILNLPQFKIYDAVIVLDSGNLVQPEFLEQMNDAYESSGTKVIQSHRISRNLDTSFARLDAIFEEINNSIFRRGHTSIGLSASLNSAGYIFDFLWFKQHIMKIRNQVGEDKELEAMLLRESIYIDYADDILVYDLKTRRMRDFNNQRGRWAYIQLHALVNNIKFLPTSLMNRRYDQFDKIVQWLLVPRTVMMGIIGLMSITLPFIYFTLAIKWWAAAAIVLFAYSLATPDYLVGKEWDRDFLRVPFVTIGALFNVFRAGKNEAEGRINTMGDKIKNIAKK